MGYTNKTTKFQLPQFIKTDKPQMTDFNDAFKNIEDKAFPNTGGEISGNIEVKNNSPVIAVNNNSTGRSGRVFSSSDGNLYIRNSKNDNNRMAIYLQQENSPNFYNVLRLQKMLNGAASYYSILGEHNKPTGSYTGNGSAEKREISIGGIGNALMLFSGEAVFCFVWGGGAIAYDTAEKSTYHFTASEINFVNGILTITTLRLYVNGSGRTIKYQVI